MSKPDSWRLEDFFVYKSLKKDVFLWRKWYQDPKAAEISMISGLAFCHKETDTVLLLPWWSVEDNNILKTFDDVQKFLASLPPWNMTSYYWHISESCGQGELLNCQTHEEVPKVTRDRILSKLGLANGQSLTKNYVIKYLGDESK